MMSKVRILTYSWVILFLSFQGCLGKSWWASLTGKIPGSRIIETTSPSGLPYTLLSFQPVMPDEKFPLLIVFTPSKVSVEEYFERWYGLAEKERVMILVPKRVKSYQADLNGLKEFYQLVDEVSEKYPVNSRKIYIAGSSAGGFIAQWLVHHQPEKWAGAVFIATPPYLDWLDNDLKISDLPPLFFIHGKQDNSFPYSKVQETVQSLTDRGVKVDFFLDEEAGHEHSFWWDENIHDWLLAHIRAGNESLSRE